MSSYDQCSVRAVKIAKQSCKAQTAAERNERLEYYIARFNCDDRTANLARTLADIWSRL